MKKKKKKSFISIIITTIVIFIIANLHFDDPLVKKIFRPRRINTRYKACYSNIRILLGAVEMYNMDHETMMTDLKTDKLLADGYLKSEISLPDSECKYFATGDLTGDGEICCELHGIIQESDKIKPEPDIVIKNQRKIEQERFKDNLDQIFMSSIPAIIYLMVALIL
jgi:competence protein ComGC